MFSIVAVCTGNICRSPQVEYVLRAKLGAAALSHLVSVSSCGLQGHEGWPADRRSDRVATAAGFSLAAHRGRAICDEDLRAGLVLALDAGHLHDLRQLAGGAHARLLMDFAGVDERGVALRGGVSVVDPYYEDPAVFDTVLAMIIRACDGLVAALAALQARDTPQTQWSACLCGDLKELQQQK